MIASARTIAYALAYTQTASRDQDITEMPKSKLPGHH